MPYVESLIGLCIKGDAKAQKALFNSYSRKMFMHCYRYLKNKEDAEDALVQGFLKVFQNLGKMEYRGENEFEAWVRKVMVNESLLLLRSKKGILFFDVKEAEEVEIESKELAPIDAESVFRLITTLPTGLRTIFNLYAIEGYSHKEIAAMLDVTESTSRSQLMKARKALQESLTKNKTSYEA